MQTQHVRAQAQRPILLGRVQVEELEEGEEMSDIFGLIDAKLDALKAMRDELIRPPKLCKRCGKRPAQSRRSYCSWACEKMADGRPNGARLHKLADQYRPAVEKLDEDGPAGANMARSFSQMVQMGSKYRASE